MRVRRAGAARRRARGVLEGARDARLAGSAIGPRVALVALAVASIDASCANACAL